MFKDIDPNEPSTLSSILVTDILRKEFNYSGLIVTDDMNMLHTSMSIGVKEAMQRAVNAGVNQLLYVGYPKPKSELIGILSNLIETGGVEPSRVQDSLLKVLQAKRDLI
jgi:beta-N-acetylhexosaminidase